MSEDKKNGRGARFMGVEKPRTVHEWIAVIGFICALAAGYLSFAMADTIVQHNENDKAHPEFSKEIELLKQRAQSDRQFAELVQRQNDRDHRQILELLQEIKTAQNAAVGR